MNTVAPQGLKNSPITIEDLRALLTEQFDHETQKNWSVAWDAPDLANEMCEPETVRRMLKGATESERIVLSEFASTGGRSRGETVRKTLTLRGHDDASKAIRALAQRGLLLPIPDPRERSISLNRIAQRSSFLKTEFALTKTMVSEIVTDERLGAQIDSREGLEPANVDEPKQFAMNLLVLHSVIARNPIGLTKQDIPNRRTLNPLASALWIANEDCPGPFDSENLVHMDELSFAIGVLFGLGAVKVENSTIIAAPLHVEDLNTRSLADAYLRTELWSESDREGMVRHITSSLPGLRNYTRSVMSRIGTEDWISVRTLVRYCRAVDSVFFERAVSHHDISPAGFVRVWIDAMARVGAIQKSTVDDEVFIREVAYKQPEQDKSFVVQPSGEISAFFDPLTYEVAHMLLRIAEVDDRLERTISLRITPESAQQGFVSGLSDVDVIGFLNDFGVTPLPGTTEFQLQDWYRVHRQHSVFVDGALIRCRDFDALDMALGQLKHDNPDAIIERLTGDTVYVFGVEDVSRLFRDFVEVSQLSEMPVPCLRFRDRFIADFDSFRARVGTYNTLEQLGTIKTAVGSERITFDMDLVRKRWPADPYHELVSFLEPLTEDGLPARQLVAFRHDLLGVEKIQVQRDVILLTIGDEMLADALERVEGIRKGIDERVGPITFAVKPSELESVMAVLKELNVGVEHE